MTTPPHPALTFLVALFSRWVNRHQHRVIVPGAEVGRAVGTVHRHDRLGGVLRYYHRAA